MSKLKYEFRGIKAHVEDAAKDAGVDDPAVIARASAGHYASLANAALGRLAEKVDVLGPECLADARKRIEQVKAALKLQLAAIDAAATEAFAALGPEKPEKADRPRKPPRRPDAEPVPDAAPEAPPES